VLGSARAFTNPAGQALMMNIVPDDEFTSAVSWNNSITQSATIIGPGLGGLLYPLGATVPFIVAFVFFTAAVLFALNIVPRPNKGTKPPITFDMLVAGYRYIWGKPVILGSITLDLVAVLLGGATALLPVYARDIFFAGPWALGVLRATPSVGSILAALILAHRPMRKNVGLIMFISVFIYGLATIGFALSTHILVAMVFLVILGAADMVSVVIRQTFIQVETPNEMRGRVIAVHTILTGTSNQLGDFESGTLAHFVGAVNSVLIGGIGALGATGLWMYLFPSLRNRQSFEAEPREEQIKSNP
jgi:MFS family permease